MNTHEKKSNFDISPLLILLALTSSTHCPSVARNQEVLDIV